MGVEKKKSIITRYSIVAFALTLVGLAIIIKASYIMFGERTYWHEVANLFYQQEQAPASGAWQYNFSGRQAHGQLSSRI